MQGVCNKVKRSTILVLLLGLLGMIAGCDSGDSSTAAATQTPTDQTPTDQTPTDGLPTATPIPTAPAGLPALTGAAAGSAGFNVITSPGMTPPAVSSSLVPRMTPLQAEGTIIDGDAAIRLGKALFWDMQTGSDGQMACASCHFNAGADNRTTNTIHPGPDAQLQLVPAPGASFTFATFDPLVVNDIVGSSGVLSRMFGSISADLADPVDICTPLVPADLAQALLASAQERLVTGRNTPPAIGAVFFLDNFWDGRASQNFNGQNPLGTGTPVARLASLASQSVGPPLSDVEMSCAGRTWNGPNSLGAKLVPRAPLVNQMVHPEDSVLGPLANPAGNGLDCGFADRLCTYADLIAAAFGTNGLSGQDAVNSYIDNFSSIWGQAVQAYEATLVPDRTPYDLGTITANQVIGLQEMRDGGCMVCHVEPEFSDATVRSINTNGGPGVQKLVGGLPG